MRPGIVVGLAAEARLARGLGCAAAIGGGTEAGAEQAAARLIAGGATALISFGLAGGLDPALRPGTIIVPAAVFADGTTLATDPGLNARLGGTTAHLLLATAQVLATAAEKQARWTDTGAAAADMESGAVARAAAGHGLPFAVLRAICDPAERDLPPAALAALNHRGAIGLGRVAASVARHPAQIPALLALARDAAAARRALADRVRSCGALAGP